MLEVSGEVELLVPREVKRVTTLDEENILSMKTMRKRLRRVILAIYIATAKQMLLIKTWFLIFPE
jgi:hypothetical protein